jgi:hypothetical protein
MILGLRFGLYPAYKVSQLSNAMTLTSDPEKQYRVLPLLIVIKYTKFYDHGGYGSVYPAYKVFY